MKHNNVIDKTSLNIENHLKPSNFVENKMFFFFSFLLSNCRHL